MALHIRFERAGAPIAWCALLVISAACTDLRSEDERPDLDGSAAEGGDSGAGMSGQSGGAGAGMSGSGASGGSSGESGQGGSGSGGSSGEGGSGDASASDGDVDEAPSDAGQDAHVPTDPDDPIKGKVIDYFGNPVAEAVVACNDTTTVSGSDGEFELPSVAEGAYSISVVVEVERVEGIERAGYLFVGLTRRNPTLQVVRGLPEERGDITRNVDGVTFPLPSTEQIPFDFASSHGGLSGVLDSDGATSAAAWEGPSEVSGDVHAIRLERATTAPQLPTEYLAHDSAPLAVAAGSETSFTLDLGSSGVLASDTISGTVTGFGPGARRNQVFVRFIDDAAVQVVDHDMPEAAYEYLVPSIPNASITLAAMRGNLASPPYAVRYRDGIAPGVSGVDLDVPLPPTQVAPDHQAEGVNDTTVFSWTGPDIVYMFYAKRMGVLEYYYVITTAKQITLPLAEPDFPALSAGTTYFWYVATHHEHATVDAATGPFGYLDGYCTGRLRGPNGGSGAHTQTQLRSFSAAP